MRFAAFFTVREVACHIQYSVSQLSTYDMYTANMENMIFPFPAISLNQVYAVTMVSSKKFNFTAIEIINVDGYQNDDTCQV